MTQLLPELSALYSVRVTMTECLNRWFQETGKKKRAVAKKAGMLPSKISGIVTGRNPDPRYSTVEKLAKGFGVSVEEFLAGPRQERIPVLAESANASVEDRLRAFLAYLQTIEQPERGIFRRALIALLPTLEQTSSTDAPTTMEEQPPLGEAHAAHRRRR